MLFKKHTAKREKNFVSIKTKLIRNTMIIIFSIFTVVLSVITFLNTRTVNKNMQKEERNIRNSIITKGNTLAYNNSMVMGAMVDDNAFTEIQRLVSFTVKQDPDIVYGIFMDDRQITWVNASDKNPKGKPKNKAPLKDRSAKWARSLKELSNNTFFYDDEKIIEFAAPVIFEKQVLGHIRYGISTKSMNIALKETFTEGKKTQNITNIILLFLGFLSLGVTYFIVRLVASKITNSLTDMAILIKDLKQLDNSIMLSRKKHKNEEPNELDQVISSINSMIENLKKSAQEMKERARMEGELNAAALVQKSFAPKKAPILNDFEISSMFYPAREISGDYYDVIKISDRYIGLIVADVSGKGVSAAMYANVARVLLRDKALIENEPVDLLCSLNNSLKKELHTNHFLTLCYMLLDIQESTVTYASAGHEPIVLINQKESEYKLLKPRGYPFSELLGDLFDSRIAQESYLMQSGDLLFCYTDGLTDVVNNEGNMYGEESLYKLIHDLSAQQITDEIYKTLMSYQGSAEQTDDITMIALKKK